MFGSFAERAGSADGYPPALDEGGDAAPRIKILWALLQGESSVACLAELVGASPTAVSQHLAKLRLAGLVKGRREGTFVHYSAADSHVRALLAEALFHADHADNPDPHDDQPHMHEPRPAASPVERLVQRPALYRVISGSMPS
ncbi:ArsR/SmtB family transcription factor [Micromonospora chersina]|uniref:Regulatory protein, arsR family n=1 Tax=Micromonospora chersina TaxID=47854 RepID=A0A1C6V1K5_9ACTN|nr:metalloregulator ArsR/SmtB family transcription factor [Micromonospora chersina]SCL60186.1 regulatory protein, arsR family [Micromonospora chersina]